MLDSFAKMVAIFFEMLAVKMSVTIAKANKTIIELKEPPATQTRLIGFRTADTEEEVEYEEDEYDV